MVYKDLSNLPKPFIEKGKTPIVSVDNGYDQQKVSYFADIDGKPQMISFCLPSRAQLGVVNMSIDGKTSGVYEVNGVFYTVNENVENPVRLRGIEYATSDLNCVLVHHSLVAAGFAGEHVKLATGLPYSHFFKNTEKNEALISAVKDSLRQKVSLHKSSIAQFDMPIIEEHVVYPESTAAFVDYAFDIETGAFSPVERGVVVADMGGGTTDITMINGGSTPSINNERSDSDDKLGVIDIKNALKKLITKKHDLDVTERDLDEAIRTGNVHLFGAPVDVTDLLSEAKTLTTEKLKNFISETIGKGASLDKVLFVGGGANALKEFFLAIYPHGVVLEDPEFCNSRGMLKYMVAQSA